VETVRVESGIGSGAALVMVAENGQRYRAVAPGANDRLTPDCVDEHGALLRSAALIVLQSELPADTVERIIRVGFHLGKKILLNVGPGQPVDPALLPYLYVLVVNAVEAEEMVGTPVETPEQAQAAARELRARGPLVAVITLGARGAAIAGPELDAVINAFPVTGSESASVDDVFCGSMAVALAEGRSIQAAARFAVAAVAVTRRGAQPSLPKRDEIEALLAAPS
jgi:ribokinase